MKKILILASLVALFMATGCARKYDAANSTIFAYWGAQVTIVNIIKVEAEVPKKIDASGELDLDPFPIP